MRIFLLHFCIFSITKFCNLRNLFIIFNVGNTLSCVTLNSWFMDFVKIIRTFNKNKTSWKKCSSHTQTIVIVVYYRLIFFSLLLDQFLVFFLRLTYQLTMNLNQSFDSILMDLLKIKSVIHYNTIHCYKTIISYTKQRFAFIRMIIGSR